jgi:uroporphyrinogen-III synthase
LATGRRVILTRPASDSQTWNQGLQAAGYEVHDWPLIEIAPATNQALIHQALADWQQYQAVMFVSRNAVTHAFLCGKPAAGWGDTRCWATGPGTHLALSQAGVPAYLIDAPAADANQFDTEALWQVVHTKLLSDKPVLILRGSEAEQLETAAQGVGRDWLMQQLALAGVAVNTLAVYERACPSWTQAQLGQASSAASDGSVWVFSSSQAVVNLQKLLPAQDWSSALVVATHERIAQAAKSAGVRSVQVCKPTLAALQSSLESLA